MAYNNSVQLLNMSLSLTEAGEIAYLYDCVPADDLAKALNERYPEDEAVPDIVQVHSWMKGYLDELNQAVGKYYGEVKQTEAEDDDTVSVPG